MNNNVKELLIIIPAYNEAKNMGTVLSGVEKPEISEVADVLFMDDASQDDTRLIAKSHHHFVVTHVYNLGYGSGLQLGYKYAVRHGYKYVIQMDADGQHDVCNILKIYECLKTPDENGKCPDIVLGSRFVEGSAFFKVGIIKKFAMSLFRTLIKLGTRKKVSDPTTGLQGLSTRAFSFYAQYNHFDDKYPDANMIMQMLLLGFRVTEVPAVMHQREEGVSMHSGLKPILYMFRMAFSIIAVWVRIRMYKVDVGVADEDNAS